MPVCGHESKILAQKKWTGFIQPLEKRKMSWLHPAHGEKKNGLVASRSLRERKKDYNGVPAFTEPLHEKNTYIKTEDPKAI